VPDAEALARVRGLRVAAWHLPAAALLDLPLVEAAAAEGTPLWIDTAMAALDEVGETVAAALKGGARVVLLHGLSTTPARPDELNLRALVTLRERFGLPVGWHGRDATPALVAAAVALGATVVAVPFDPAGQAGCDAAALRALCADAALVERARGDGDKRVQPSEWAVRDRAHPSLVARVDIARGQALTAEMLSTAAPGIGLKPRAAAALVGRRAVVDIAAGTLITLGMLE
jgi:N-acetylneuraminate synthase/N,N'-diacetyllegionaminate synthase